MSSIKETIKAEIERLKGEVERGNYYLDSADMACGYEAALDDLLAFIDSLPEETCKDSPLPEDTVLFQKGVEEGRRLEKDGLSLTWEDIANIDAIILDVNNEFAVDYSKEINRQKFYEEVLRRFNEIKYGHEKDTK